MKTPCGSLLKLISMQVLKLQCRWNVVLLVGNGRRKQKKKLAN